MSYSPPHSSRLDPFIASFRRLAVIGGGAGALSAARGGGGGAALAVAREMEIVGDAGDCGEGRE